MKALLSRLLPILVLGAAIPGAGAQDIPLPGADEAAIRRASLDYVEGALLGDAARVERGIHPGLVKMEITTLPQNGRQALVYNTATTLMAWVRGEAAAQFAEVDKSVEVEVFWTDHGIATARVLSVPWCDFLHLARVNGAWQVVNVVWANRDPEAPSLTHDPGARSQVEAAALDFVDGLYASDAERVGRAMSPELNKILLQHHPKSGEEFLYRLGSSAMLEATAAGLFSVPPEGRKIQVEVLDISHDLASVKVASAQFIDLFLMARMNGEWKILNNLWVANPTAPPMGG